MYLSSEARSRLLIPMITVCLAATLFMGWIGEPLNMAWNRSGILELEFCWIADCVALMAEWPSPEIALPGLYADYGYLVVYSAVIGLACIQAGGVLSERWSPWGVPLAWLLVAAALCDAVENAALIRLVSGADGPEAAISFVCASVKFAFVGLGLVYSAAGAIAYMRGSR